MGATRKSAAYRTRKNGKFDKRHPGLTRTEWAKVKRDKRAEKRALKRSQLLGDVAYQQKKLEKKRTKAERRLFRARERERSKRNKHNKKQNEMQPMQNKN